MTALRNRLAPSPVMQDRMRLKELKRRARKIERMSAKAEGVQLKKPGPKWSVRWTAREKSVRVSPERRSAAVTVVDEQHINNSSVVDNSAFA